MILDVVIGIGLLMLGGLIGLFPAYTLPGDVQSFGSSIGNAVATANGIFPIVTLGVCIALILGLALFLALFDVLVWVYDKVPFKAT